MIYIKEINRLMKRFYGHESVNTSRLIRKSGNITSPVSIKLPCPNKKSTQSSS